MTSQDAWTDLSIGDAVEDANGRRWWVLNRPDGSVACDGLFAAATNGYGQRYGEHMFRPVARLDHRCTWQEPCSRPLEPHCPPEPAANRPRWWYRPNPGARRILDTRAIRRRLKFWWP